MSKEDKHIKEEYGTKDTLDILDRLEIETLIRETKEFLDDVDGVYSNFFVISCTFLVYALSISSINNLLKFFITVLFISTK